MTQKIVFFSNWILKRINQSIKASKKLSAIIISLEDDVADIGLIRQFGVEYYGPIMGNISGKRILDKSRQKKLNQFYQSIIEQSSSVLIFISLVDCLVFHEFAIFPAK